MSYCHPVHLFSSAFQKQQFWPAPFLLLCIPFAVHEVLFRAIEGSRTRDNQSSMSSLEDVTVAPIFPNMCCCRGADVGLTIRDKTCHRGLASNCHVHSVHWPRIIICDL